tara:strand:+ start:716 stop:997 length:282 start_codon:yes stop_codon:yes gene_type:complete
VQTLLALTFGVELYAPAAQVEHDAELASGTSPGLHDSQASSTGLDDAVLGAHCTHEYSTTVRSRNFPATHAVQTIPTSSRILPLSQSVHPEEL